MKCVICSKKFTTHVPKRLYCSSQCSALSEQKRNGRFERKMLDVSRGTVGAISEIEVSADLMRKGYSVFRSMSPSCFCDIIAIQKNIVLKIEVRTGVVNKRNKQISFTKNISPFADCFAVNVLNERKTFYFDKNFKEINL